MMDADAVQQAAPAVFHFDAVHGALLGQSAADASPLEPGVWLVPAYATLVPPPMVGEREVPVWDGSAWATLPDWRGVALFSTADGSPVQIDRPGQSPQDVGATPTPRPDDGHVWHDGAWHPRPEETSHPAPAAESPKTENT